MLDKTFRARLQAAWTAGGFRCPRKSAASGNRATRDSNTECRCGPPYHDGRTAMAHFRNGVVRWP